MLRLYRSLRRICRDLYHHYCTDVYIVSYPKSGRTWLRVMLWKYLVDTFNVETRELDLRKLTGSIESVPVVAMTHDLASLTDRVHTSELYFRSRRYRNKAVVFLVRDVRDTVTSAYHQAVSRANVYEGSLSSFIRDERFGIGKAVAFNNMWYRNRSVPRKFLLLRYEDFHSDAAEQLESLLSFLGLESCPERVEQAVGYAEFENMRRLEEVGFFEDPAMTPANQSEPQTYKTRRGEVGGYKDELVEEDQQFVEEFIRSKLDPGFGYSY